MVADMEPDHNDTSPRAPASWTAAAGLAWLALGLESIVRPEAQDYRDIAFLVPWCLTLGGMTALYRLQRERLSRAGRVGYLGVVVAMTSAIIGSVPLILGVTETHFMLAVPLWVLAMAVFGGASARSGVLPRWIGVAVALAEPLTIATGVALSPWVPLVEHGSFSGAVAHGVIFLSIARALRVTSLQAISPRPNPTALDEAVA
jgi:hypothetical protein